MAAWEALPLMEAIFGNKGYKDVTEWPTWQVLQARSILRDRNALEARTGRELSRIKD